jgi:hypothetical protein
MLIRELPYEELQEPERTKTVVVSDWQTNLLISALTMPCDASMLFEHTQGSPEITWGFEVNPGKGYIPELIRSEFTRSDLAV